MARLGKLTLASFLGSLLLPASLFALPPAPSIDEQLEKAGIRKGTALEQLVRENQSFGMLRAAERDSNSRVPAWLKVWYRKQNPHLEYNAADPTGGYPHVLKEILEWMVSHQDLRPGVNEPDVPPGFVNFPGGGIGRDLTPADEEAQSLVRDSLATAGTNVRASGAQTSRRSESDIRVNYWNTNKIIAGSNNIGGSGWQAQFYSTDGGTTWGQTTLPATSGDSFNSDPTVDWTSDGTAWATTMGITSGSQARMKLFRSTDSGASWTYHSTASGTQTNVDKQMMWVDHSATSPYKDRIYLIWHNGLPAFMNVFNGTSWGTPIQVSGSETTGTGIGADVKTNSFGDVFGAWPDTTSRGIYLVKSTNGGGSYSTPVRIRTTFGGYDIGVPSFNGRRVLIYVSLGAYRTASKNNVYAVWADFTGATGCTANANEPGSNVSSTCKTRIWFARSTDGGATFGAASMLNNQAGLNDQFNPFLVVDETNGTVAVMYYDTVADAGRKKTHVYYQSSVNDGATWSAAMQVTTAQTDETGSGADTGNQYGDYNGLSGIAGTFFPSWTDRRNGTNEEIWTAKITEGAPPVTYTVSGNAGTTGATVSAGSSSATSDASSNYTIANLVAGTYTVTPSKAGCTFSPTSQSVTVGPNATGLNFSASCSATTYSIAGNAGTTGATVTAGSASATSDASSNYTLSGLVAGTYTVTPTKSGCTFTPASQSVTVGPNATGKNFTASCTSGDTQLTSGVTLSGQSVALQQWKYYYITVPAGATNLTFTTTGATTDLDIYTQVTNKPTLSSYICRPYGATGNETCSATNPAAGTWWL
ncbi:MAG: pre-peptidase C-terminal domain-containing protein, partial [Acidobacteria bacterium]|nr:pre-peptidase C-terminal domain-containing protein [Acidobacteriota bacterium]